MATPAHAAPVIVDTTGDVTVDEASASGDPVAVHVATTGGSATVSVTDVTAAATGDTFADAVFVGTDGTGAITANFGTVAVSGDGNVRAVYASADAGDVDLTVGTATVDGTATAGVHGHSNSGDVRVTVDSVVANGTGIDPNFEVFPEAVLAGSEQGAATAVVGYAETSGLYGSAVVVGAGTVATAQVDTAIAHSAQSNAIDVYGRQGAAISVGTVIAGGTGIAARTEAGATTTITAGTVEAGLVGIVSNSAGNISISADNLTADRGVYANTTAGAVSVSVNQSLDAAGAYGIRAGGTTVDIAMGADSSLTSGGSGIYADGQDGVTVTAHDVDAMGQAIRAQSANGSASVSVDGTVASATMNAISVNAVGATVEIAQGAVLSGHGGGATVAVGAGTGGVTINNLGRIEAYDAAGSGIGLSTDGNIRVDSAEVVLVSNQVSTSQYVGAGISLVGLGNGDVTLNSGSIMIDAPERKGIYVDAAGTGNATVNFDTVDTNANGSDGVLVKTVDGDIAITGGTLASTGEGTVALHATSTNGDIAVTVDTVTNAGTSVYDNQMVFGEGVFAESTNGMATLNVGSAMVTGAAASAAIAIGGAGASIAIDNASAAGQFAAAVYAYSGQGNATVDAGTVTLSGANQGGINAISDNGSATVVSDTVTSTGTMANGIFARGAGDVTVQSGTVTAQNYGIYGRSTGNAAVSITTTGDTTADELFGIYGRGGAVTIATAEGSVTAGGTRGIWGNGASVTIVNAGTASASGDLGSAILAQSDGAISITSANAVVTGAGADPGVRADGSGYRIEQGGIIAETLDAPITIDSGTVTVAGEYRYGISARSDGAISITAGDTTLESADSLAIAARGGAGDVTVTTGTTIANGVSSGGVFASSTTGNIVIDADVTRANGEGQMGNFTADAVVAISEGGDVSITSHDASSAGLWGSAVVGLTSGAGNVSIVSDTAATTGMDGAAVYGGARGTGSVSIVSNTLTTELAGQAIVGVANGGAVTIHTGTITAAADGGEGVYARGLSSTIVVDGAMTTGGRGIYSQTIGGRSDIMVEGSVTSRTGSGIVAVGQGANVEVGAGASVAGGRAGVVISGFNAQGYSTIVNHGTISGTEAGIYVEGAPNPNLPQIAPDTIIFNDGVIASAEGLAILTGGGADILELTENSVIDGIVNLGDNYDVLALGLNDGVLQGTGQVAQTVNVERMSISSGNWIANTGHSFYDSIVIDAGSRLEVQQVDGYTAVLAPDIELNGELALNFDTDTQAGDLTGLQLYGAGELHLTGGATILVDDASGLQYTGGTFVEDGTLLLTDEYGYQIYTSGDGTFQLGDGGTTGHFTGDLVNDGRFVFARADDYTFVGDFSGTGALDKYGMGTLVFDGLYAFDGLTTIYEGAVALTGALAADTELAISGGIFDLSMVDGGAQTIASLSGTGGTLVLGDTALTVMQEGTTVYAGDITGSGSFIVDGTGDLKLSGDISFMGDALINSGTLSVNGSMTMADFYIGENGTLGGNGEVGTVVATGGTVGAGNSIGLLTVVGDLTLDAASTLEIEVNAAGMADLVDVTGTATLGGATASVLAQTGNYRPFTSYTVLTAGAIDGTFGDVTTNFAFLTPTLLYSANAVTLELRRNDIAFSALGTTPNQSAVGALVEGLGVGTAIYNEALLLTRGQVAAGFGSLTGEAYPAFASGLVETAQLLGKQVRPAIAPEAAEGSGLFAWGSGLLANASGSAPGYRAVDFGSKGIAGGLGYRAGSLTASLGLGQAWHDVDDLGVSDANTMVLAGLVAWSQPFGFNGELSLQKGWTEGALTRRTALGAINDTLTGTLDGGYTLISGELGYGFGSETMSIAPFIGLTHTSVSLDDVAEAGGVTALNVTRLDRDVTFGTVGARLATQVGDGVAIDTSAAYRRAWGDREGAATIGFVGATGTATIGALPVAKDALELHSGLTFTSGKLTFEAGYDAALSKTFDSHSGTISVSVAF